VRRKRAKSASKPASVRRVAGRPLLLEVGRTKCIRQRLAGLDQDSLISLNMAASEALERRGNKQGAHQAADLVENWHRQTSGTFDILGERQIDAGSPGSVDPFHELIPIEYGSGCDTPEIGGPEKSLAPVGRLKRHEDHAESAVQRDFPGKRLDDLGSLRTEAPIDHDSFASLQHGEAAVFAGDLRQALDVRMDDLQQPSKQVERRCQRKKPRTQSIFAIFKPLKNSIFDERASNARDCWHRQADALAYVGH
jgi:hypothetical protein